MNLLQQMQVAGSRRHYDCQLLAYVLTLPDGSEHALYNDDGMCADN